MIISLQNESIELTEELEVILIISESSCVNNLISKLKSQRIESDIFWLKDPLQLADYLESKGRYRGKAISSNPKLFVMDGRFGLDSYEFVKQKIALCTDLAHMPLYVLSKGLSPLEKEIYTYKGIRMIDESLMNQFDADNNISFFQ